MIVYYFINCDCELLLSIVIVNYFIACDCELLLSIVIVNCIINFVSKVKAMTISSCCLKTRFMGILLVPQPHTGSKQ